MISDAIAIARESLVKPFEGYAKRLVDGSCIAYPDPGTRGAPWTIGWGCTGPDIKEGTVWSLEKAQDTLSSTLLYFAVGAIKLSPILATASDRQLAAVISWTYNCGLGNYRVSTFKKRIDAQDWNGASEECIKWNKSAGRVLAGLTKRRLAEATLLRKD